MTLDVHLSFFVDASTHDRIERLRERRKPQEGDREPTFSAVARAALARGLADIEREVDRAASSGAS